MEAVSAIATPVNKASMGRRRWALSTQIPVAGAMTATTSPEHVSARPNQAAGVVGPGNPAPT